MARTRGSKAPEASESPKPSNVAETAELLTQPVINHTLSSNAQTYCSAEVDRETDNPPTRADAATQACFELQSTEDIRTPALSKFFRRTPAETPTVNEPTYTRANKKNMQSMTTAQPQIEATPTSNLARETVAEPQNKQVVRKKRFHSPGLVLKRHCKEARRKTFLVPSQHNVTSQLQG
ncbi:hypothetical protein LX36DRAFT_665983 [Colletotrichum falcatum]|nr:hypothetical protein LX36DRAFT_665983 [Colletotrichum falcatum]